MEIASKDLRELQQRVVVHIDMDCFYVQVEQQLKPELQGKPVAVVQYNDWKGGGLIAVGYEARRAGVKRGMRGDEAKKLCPEIHLVKVEVANEKANLSKYRTASKNVFNILTSNTTRHVERISIDEAFVDITAEVDAELNRSTPSLPESTMLWGVDEPLKFVTSTITPLEQRMLAAGTVTERIREEVSSQLGYTCSAGIAGNKIAAKLATGFNKPNGQTIFLPCVIDKLWSVTPVSKLRNLGGKFGEKLRGEYGIETVLDIRQHSRAFLIEHFGQRMGEWLHLISYGYCKDKVQMRDLPSGIGCSKTFPAGLSGRDVVGKWIATLANELSQRTVEDVSENNRFPSLLLLHCSVRKARGGSKSMPLHPPTGTADKEAIASFVAKKLSVDFIAVSCLQLYTQLGSPSRVTSLSLSFAGFSNADGVVAGPKQGTIADLFKNAKPKSCKRQTNPIPDTVREDPAEPQLFGDGDDDSSNSPDSRPEHQCGVAVSDSPVTTTDAHSIGLSHKVIDFSSDATSAKTAAIRTPVSLRDHGTAVISISSDDEAITRPLHQTRKRERPSKEKEETAHPTLVSMLRSQRVNQKRRKLDDGNRKKLGTAEVVDLC